MQTRIANSNIIVFVWTLDNFVYSFGYYLNLNLNFKIAYLGKGRREDLFVLATELNLKFDKSMTIATHKDLIIGSENYDEELTKNIHSTIVKDRKAREENLRIEEQKEKLRIEEQKEKLRIEEREEK
ncbi:hypothetical protein TNCV_4248861 [Trichonephila clavipes]|nr:hypothetical protein TNCV_4248861 [Trichonephila clavipes]